MSDDGSSRIKRHQGIESKIGSQPWSHISTKLVNFGIEDGSLLKRIIKLLSVAHCDLGYAPKDYNSRGMFHAPPSTTQTIVVSSQALELHYIFRHKNIMNLSLSDLL